ncbi:hypothetical protein DICPUDRAFT_57141 [Dictyostelium purpureum]|uniref:Large ribosomal subunit protein mL46 n=1 Tax=Dictyostelium purpureum TaxID=5786 RepID=F0ZUJ8_DICPU|nr:uncharacterized protein DICPUDRAFT_57141 [Dictyostelium purpureum]EGC32362.1 hypothetical protein DICPUDRAFT_57141 [Dictyostelium purpureum]|eukprot:XP_003291092.1 hypothetical protein DICPUDRAFT_57141 [Dictyostelium purpureum]
MMNTLVRNCNKLNIIQNEIRVISIRGYSSDAQAELQKQREEARLDRIKKSKENAKKVDTRNNTEKILEKFDIPRIIDLSDPVYRSHQKNMKEAQKRINKRDESLPKLDSPHAGVFKYTSAVIIERFPSLNPLPTEYEEQYYQSVQRLEEIIRRPPIRMLSIVEDLPEFKIEVKEKKEGEEDAADEFEEDFSNYQPESRLTEDDIKDNRQSLDRKLDKSLYLIIKKAGSRYEWQFPATNWIKGESIKNTAERALRDSVGSKWKYWIPSQSPCGVYKYRVENDVQDLIKAEGIKEFFFRAHYFGGELQFNPKIVEDYKWVSKEELKEYFTGDYYNETHKLIFDDCFMLILTNKKINGNNNFIKNKKFK